jgi:hypothetical protein
MNNDEAKSIVREELMKYRSQPYAKLALLVGTRIPPVVVKGTSGPEYQVEVQVHWDAKPDGDLRVLHCRSQ